MKNPGKLMIGCLFLQSISAFGAENATKPNIILIMTDQQSYNMISALQNTYTSTPNIDRLVNNGISFTNTFCTNPVSVASRFSIFTGLYGGEYKIRDNQCDSASQSVVVPVLTQNGMGNVFKNNGYETVYSGKVHLPFAKNTNKFAQPINYGFSTYLTDDERDGLGDIAANYISNRTSTSPLLLVVSFLNPHDICLESSTNLSTDVEVDPKKPEIAATINSIRDLAATYDSVYFYNNLAPELPTNYERTIGFPAKFTPSAFDEFPDYYWRKYRWIYGKLVELVDGHIGKVLNAIDQWSQKDNTIVIFTSDHGEMQGAHHATVKNLPFEECQHVPFIISGKGIVKNERDSSLICNGTDIIPTLCELAGINIPTNLPGISVAQRALGKTEVTQRKYLYLEGDGFSQMVENPDYRYTYFITKGANEMLIDSKNDRGETTNVIDQNSVYSTKAGELSDILNQYLDKNMRITTSVNSPIINKSASIYPNPVTDFMVIDLDEKIAQLKIYNIAGVEFTSCIREVTHQNDKNFIQISKIPSGLYIAKINNTASVFSVK